MKDRFGTIEADFFTSGNLGDIGDEKAIKFYVTGLGALKYAMENREKSINPDDVDEVEKVISDTETATTLTIFMMITMMLIECS